MQQRGPRGSEPREGTAAEDVARYRANLQGEIDGAAVYAAMAEAEKDPALRELYHRLAETETRHGQVWRDRLEAAGVATREMGPSWRTRILMWIARRFGPGAVVATIAEKEFDRPADVRRPARGHGGACRRTSARTPGCCRELADGRGLEGATLARIEGRHRRAAATPSGRRSSAPTTASSRTSAS